jgi:hypothetical protein
MSITAERMEWRGMWCSEVNHDEERDNATHSTGGKYTRPTVASNTGLDMCRRAKQREDERVGSWSVVEGEKE